MKILAAIVMLALLVTLVGCSNSETGNITSPLDAARHYLDDERMAAYSDAYGLLSSDSQHKIGQTEFVDRLTRARNDENITQFSIVSVGLPDPTTRTDEAIIVGQRASVPYSVTVTFKDGTKQTLIESMVLLKEGDNWRVVWPPA